MSRRTAGGGLCDWWFRGQWRWLPGVDSRCLTAKPRKEWSTLPSVQLGCFFNSLCLLSMQIKHMTHSMVTHTHTHTHTHICWVCFEEPAIWSIHRSLIDRVEKWHRADEPNLKWSHLISSSFTLCWGFMLIVKITREHTLSSCSSRRFDSQLSPFAAGHPTFSLPLFTLALSHQ